MRAWTTMTFDQALRDENGLINWSQFIDEGVYVHNYTTTENFKEAIYERYFDYEIGFETKQFFVTKFALRFRALKLKYDILFKKEEEFLKKDLYDLIDTESTEFSGLSENDQNNKVKSMILDLFSDTPSGTVEPSEIQELLKFISSTSKNRNESEQETKGKITRNDKGERVFTRSVDNPFEVYLNYTERYNTIMDKFVGEFHNLFLMLR